MASEECGWHGLCRHDEVCAVATWQSRRDTITGQMHYHIAQLFEKDDVAKSKSSSGGSRSDQVYFQIPELELISLKNAFNRIITNLQVGGPPDCDPHMGSPEPNICPYIYIYPICTLHNLHIHPLSLPFGKAILGGCESLAMDYHFLHPKAPTLNL